jgi:ABC-type polar amino acid transport system ATPase subunit
LVLRQFAALDRSRLTALIEEERRRFVDAHPRSRAAFERARGSMLGGVPMNWMDRWVGGFPVLLDHAEGARATDIDGHTYVDFCLGDTGAMAGHSPAATVRAVRERVARGVTAMLPSEDGIWVAEELKRRFGVLYQYAALFSSMTLEENVSLPLLEHAGLAPGDARAVARLKLALVGLAGFERHYPSEISGGMKKRAGLARAMALDPEILYFDEPSAGLDPVSARLLDQLILELRDSLGATVVVVSHELDSIYTIASNGIFLDTETRTIVASGDPHVLRTDAANPAVRRFLNRGTDPREERT